MERDDIDRFRAFDELNELGTVRNYLGLSTRGFLDEAWNALVLRHEASAEMRQFRYLEALITSTKAYPADCSEYVEVRQRARKRLAVMIEEGIQ